jgi:hypothetical protein
MRLRRNARGIRDIIQEECRKRRVSEKELRKSIRRARIRPLLAIGVRSGRGFSRLGSLEILT